MRDKAQGGEVKPWRARPQPMLDFVSLQSTGRSRAPQSEVELVESAKRFAGKESGDN